MAKGGRGVASTRTFQQGEFVCEYAGDLISEEEAKEREFLYQKDSRSYMYFFTYKSPKLW